MRKADAYMDEESLQCVHRIMLSRATERRCRKPLYALSPDEFIVTREQLERWAKALDTIEGSVFAYDELDAILTGDTGR